MNTNRRNFLRGFGGLAAVSALGCCKTSVRLTDSAYIRRDGRAMNEMKAISRKVGEE